MPQKIITLFVLILAFSSPATAGLAFPKTTHTYTGNLLDTSAKVDYTFKNTGKTIVEIVSIRTSCGCTSGKTQSQFIKPGENSVLTLTYAYGDRYGYQTANATIKTREWAKVPAIKTADQKGFKQPKDKPKPLTQKDYRIRLNVILPQPAKVSRNLVMWQKGRLSQNQTLSLKISHDKPVKIKAITSANNLMDSTYTYDKKTKQYHITLIPNTKNIAKAVDPTRDSLIIQTDLPGRYKNYKIHCRFLGQKKNLPNPQSPILKIDK